jgi:hypothetical protein
MTKRILLSALGYLFCIVPPVLAILERFPLFAHEGSAPVLSGLAFLLLLVAVIPLRRGLASLLEKFLRSPSAFTVWGLIWIIFEVFGRIAASVADVALIATVSSLIGAVFFRLAKGREST